MKPLRIVFAGTPEFAVPPLKALVEAGHSLRAVYTQPDRAAGRGRQIRPGPVKEAALALGLPVEQPLSLKDPGTISDLGKYAPDVMVVVAYGLLLPQSVLDLPRYGCLNIHASLLPRWRGAAPIQRAIQTGDPTTGVTIMQMEAGLDSGPILSRASAPIAPEDTAGSLHDRLSEMGARLIVKALEAIAAGTEKPQQQDPALVTYASKLSKQESRLDWHGTARDLVHKIQAFNPWPVAETHWGGRVLRLYGARQIDASSAGPPGRILAESSEGIDVASGEGVVRILGLQLPGRRVQTAAEFINGHSLLGQTFDS